VIAGGTVLGGRYLIEGERPGQRDEPPSWWALDRMLKRRVVVVVMPGDTHSLDVARTARMDYAGRLLDGGEHEGVAYLVIRADRAAPPPGPAPRPGPDAVADGTVAMPLPDRGATGPLAPPPMVHSDATEAFAQPLADATAVQPLPTMAGVAPGYALPAPPPPPSGVSLSNQAFMRMAAMVAVSFVLGAGAVFGVAVVASPEPYTPTGPVSAAGGDDGPPPDRTLPANPVTQPTMPVTVAPTSTTTTVPTTSTTAEPPKPTRRPRPTTTRRSRFPRITRD
jgi:hypothetical protein